MKMVKLSVLVFVVFALGMLFVGCSKPPEAEKAAAKKAMDAAISADADKYATADLETAKKLWSIAESQLKEKKYKEAKQNFIDARAAFEKAAAAVEAGKKAVADQANESLETLEVAWKKLSTTAKKMEKNKVELLHKELSYEIQGIAFEIRKSFGLGHKEQIYQKVFEKELKQRNLP